MKVSVVIAVETINDYVKEGIAKILSGDFSDLEILVFTSQASSERFPKTRLISRPELAGNPAQRRDLALIEARGEILGFLDDDAYPSPVWLSAALKHFDDPRVAAVGGPGVTPPEDDWRRQVSGYVHTSPVGAGSFSFRFQADKSRQVDDYPSMNLMVRKSDFAMVGGFDSNFWPGEDTKLCLDLTYKLNKKIIYEPEALVYHHRRPIFKAHLLQAGRYGLHRGYFAKVLPQTSRRLVYFLPSVLFLTLAAGAASLPVIKIFGFRISDFGFRNALLAYFLLLASYFLLLFLNAVWVWRRCRSVRIAFWTIPAIFLTHLWYGFQFLRGLASSQLKR